MIFLQIALCARFWLIYTNPILIKIDIHLRYVIMHVWNCRFLKFTIEMAIKCNLKQFRKMGRYCNDYYDKFPEAIKLKCGYDLNYIIKYV